jgi:uncharacterized membrane protein YebE (DUF533 family)
MMFDPEKLLGGLIRSRIGGRGTNRLLKGGAAMALLGVALEAAEHYMKTSSEPSSPQPAPSGPPSTPPSARPDPQMPRPTTSVPPPPPDATPEQAVSPRTTNPHQDSNPAVLLIRAMIAAAHADGQMDTLERRRILRQWQTIDLSPEEQAFLSEELLSPSSLAEIVRCVADRKQALQVYALSRLVMEIDSEAERAYLHHLAQALHLNAQTVRNIEDKLRSAASGGGSSQKGA